MCIAGTCFYIGPILRQLTLNSTRDIDAFNRTYSADLRLANSTDPYVTSPVLTAYNKCLYGPSSLQNPPSWLYYSFGPTVSIDGPSNPLQTSSLNLTGVTLSDKLKCVLYFWGTAGALCKCQVCDCKEMIPFSLQMPDCMHKRMVSWSCDGSVCMVPSADLTI